MKTRGDIVSVKVVRQAPPVSHLLFADDSILFSRANQDEVNKIKEIISIYEAASGERINMGKSELSTSDNLTAIRREELGRELGARQVIQYSKYLGLPTILGRGKKAIF